MNFKRGFFLALCLTTLVIGLSLGMRVYLSKLHKKSAREIASEYTPFSNEPTTQVESLNFLRGDVQVSIRKPPFKEQNWTVNTYTGQIIPWEKKKELRLTGALQNNRLKEK